MKIESPAAFRFIIDEDLYLLDKDKVHFIHVEDTAVLTEAIPIAETKEVIPVPFTFNYLGKNKKRLLILVHYTNYEFIDDAHLAALTSILKRKDLSVDDVAILNLASYPTGTFGQLDDFFKPERWLMMGERTLLPGMPELLLNQPKELANHTFLYSFSFDEMMDSNDHKKAFWEQMKNF